MALTADVTKIWPTYHPGNEEYTIAIQVALSDDGVLVRTQTFTADVNKNNVLTQPGKTIERLLIDANKWVDQYKKEKTAFGHSVYETIRAGIASGLTL